MNKKTSSLALKLALVLSVFASLILVPLARAQEAQPAAAKYTYLPVIRKSAAYDLVLDYIRPYQVTQNAGNTVTMIAGKPTMLRIFTHTTQSTPVSNIRVSISATRGGAPLAGSPLVVGPATVPTAIVETTLANSFNATLPAAWLSGAINLQITLDSNDAYGESNEGNNTASLNMTFVSVPDLNIKVVPVTYTHPDDGRTYVPSTYDFLAPGVLSMYPVARVNVEGRAGVLFSRNLSGNAQSAWSALLNTVTTLKTTDGAPFNQVYYGLIPVEDGQGHAWFYGGIAGLGWVGQRTAIGLTDSSALGLPGAEIAAHEIGHNLGRDHAPCGVTTTAPFPYTGASIGNIGIRVSPLALYSPATYTDIMGYCEYKWMSDYTYLALLTNQQRYGTASMTPAQDGMLVRGQVSESGEISLDAAYRLTSRLQPATATPEAEVQFIDASGAVVASYPVEILHTDEPELKISAINAFVPYPEKPFTTMRVSNLATGTEAVMHFSANRLAPIAAPRLDASDSGLTLHWGDANTPALVRVSNDGGASWTTLALDALGGQLNLEPASLPAGDLRFEIILAGQSNPAYTLDWQYNP